MVPGKGDWHPFSPVVLYLDFPRFVGPNVSPWCVRSSPDQTSLHLHKSDKSKFGFAAPSLLVVGPVLLQSNLLIIQVNNTRLVGRFKKYLPPATKLGQGYVFTCVCDSVYRGRGSRSLWRKSPGGGLSLSGRVSLSRGLSLSQWVSVLGGLCLGMSLSGGVSVMETPVG